MLLHTHFLLGQRIYQELSVKDQCFIDQRHFIKGNILPDIQSKFRFFHDIEHSRTYLEQAIGWLPYCVSKEKYSEQLGIITHFISDFFCSYHAYPELITKSFRSHFLYELRLHYFYQLFCKHPMKDFSKIQLVPEMDLMHQVENLQKYYLSSQSSYYKDINYSLKVGLMMNECMIQYIKKSKRLVA